MYRLLPMPIVACVYYCICLLLHMPIVVYVHCCIYLMCLHLHYCTILERDDTFLFLFCSFSFMQQYVSYEYILYELFLLFVRFVFCVFLYALHLFVLLFTAIFFHIFGLKLNEAAFFSLLIAL